jgi:hypothetical protein
VIFVLTQGVSKSEFAINFQHSGVRQIQIDMDGLIALGIEPQAHVSIATYAKILIPKLVPKEFIKCLYLDIDTYIVSSLQPILDFPLNRAIAANQFENGEAKDLFGTHNATYFSAGLMLMNLKEWRSLGITDELIALISKFPKLPRGDNDILNIYFRENWQPLPLSFNFMAEIALNGHLHNNKVSPKILHLVGSRKPWGKRGHTIWHSRYREEFLQFFPGQLELSRADTRLFKAARHLHKFLPFGFKLVPRKIKDLILKFGEKSTRS